MFLLDTNVVSELRKAPSARANQQVVRWAAQTNTNDLFISVITVMEIELGVQLIERRDTTQGAALRQWLESQVLPAFHERVLPIDLAIARRCAGLHVPDPRSERDALLAATALVHGLTMVTRNIQDFVRTGVSCLDPWADV
jgi:toxin FitB